MGDNNGRQVPNTTVSDTVGDGGGTAVLDNGNWSNLSLFTSPPSIILLNLTSMLSNNSFKENYTSSDGGLGVSDMSGGDEEEVFGSEDELPAELREMSESSKHCVIAYCILFVIATSGNLTVLLSVFKQYKKTKSRISLLILHLSIADLIVCCTLIPTEVFWRLTIQWRGGNALCKIMQFLRAFGLYLSSMVLIVVSFDRFFAILFPMKMLKRQGHQRIKVMLWVAWLASLLFSLPQALLFSIASHPAFPSFKQCVTNEFLKNTEDVRLYSIFSVSAMYFAPLVVILFTYTAIIIKLIRKSHQNNNAIEQPEDQQLNQRRSYSVRFRMSIRNHSASSRSESTTIQSNGSSEEGKLGMSNSLTLTPHHHRPYLLTHHNQARHNHSNKLSTMPPTTATTFTTNPADSRRKKLDSASSIPPDQGEFSSEEGSCSGSTCSTVNVTSNNSNTVNRKAGESLSLRQNHTQSSVASDVSTLGRANSHRTTLVLRRSDNAASTMSRAKHRTLVMTIVIVLFFVLSWTPYCVMTLWYMFDWEGAKEVNPRVQDGLFVMAVANSCVNPLIYGSFAKNCCGLSKILGGLRRTRGQ